jgi:hypothetical protein
LSNRIGLAAVVVVALGAVATAMYVTLAPEAPAAARLEAPPPLPHSPLAPPAAVVPPTPGADTKPVEPTTATTPAAPAKNLPADVRHDAIQKDVDELVAKLADEARLTPDQRTRVAAVLREQAEAAFSATAGGSAGNSGDLGPELSAIRADAEAELQAILSPEQLGPRKA